MHRTLSLKLNTNDEQNQALIKLQGAFNQACNAIVPIAIKNKCWNRVSLHHLSYYAIRNKDSTRALGSQMVCNAIKAVSNAFKALKIKKAEKLASITFKATASVHFDKRTYSLKENTLSLYSLSGRILVPVALGDFQSSYLIRGVWKEAELVCRDKGWYFNVVLDLPDVEQVRSGGNILGVDLGENNLAATSSGKLFGGGKLRHERDRALALRRRLQSSGSKSAKQLLKKISGGEARHVKHVNHVISKAITQEALRNGCDTIAMESLTNIRSRIKAGKRMRSRLHRWAWSQLQEFVSYKAQAVGLRIIFVNPAYTSQICSNCGQLGARSRHHLACKFCGIRRHSDLNASQNIRRIAASADAATGIVNRPNVAACS